MKIGIIGAGTMGIGIVQLFAKKGHQIIWCSSSLPSAQRGYDRLNNQLDNLVLKGKISEEDKLYICDNITLSEYTGCKDCELVIETIPEDLERKRKVFQSLEEICNDDCIFATNTSSFSTNEIGKNIHHNIIGLHFFNPVAIMQLVELTFSDQTSNEIENKVIELINSVGKQPIVVKENPGYIVNRLLIPMINEAVAMYSNGVASVNDIDTAMKLGANFPMGPLELCDYIGIDVCYSIMNTLQEDTGNIKYMPCLLLKEMIDQGWIGKKKGVGFYIYQGKDKAVNEELQYLRKKIPNDEN